MISCESCDYSYGNSIVCDSCVIFIKKKLEKLQIDIIENPKIPEDKYVPDKEFIKKYSDPIERDKNYVPKVENGRKRNRDRQKQENKK